MIETTKDDNKPIESEMVAVRYPEDSVKPRTDKPERRCSSCGQNLDMESEKDMFGTKEQMLAEIKRIENLNIICRTQLRHLKAVKQQIDGYESNLEKNTIMIGYIEYRIREFDKQLTIPRPYN